MKFRNSRISRNKVTSVGTLGFVCLSISMANCTEVEKGFAKLYDGISKDQRQSVEVTPFRNGAIPIVVANLESRVGGRPFTVRYPALSPCELIIVVPARVNENDVIHAFKESHRFLEVCNKLHVFGFWSQESPDAHSVYTSIAKGCEIKSPTIVDLVFPLHKP